MNEQYMTSFLQNIFTRPSTSFDIEMRTIVHPLATTPDTPESMPGALSSDVDVGGPTPTNAHSLEKPAPSPDFDMEQTMPGSLNGDSDIHLASLTDPEKGAETPGAPSSAQGALTLNTSIGDVDIRVTGLTDAYALEKAGPSPDIEMGQTIPSATGMAHNALVLNTSVGCGNIPSGDFAFSADPVMVRLSEKTDDLHGKRRRLDDIGEGPAFTRERPKQSKSKNLAYIGTVHRMKTRASALSAEMVRMQKSLLDMQAQRDAELQRWTTEKEQEYQDVQAWRELALQQWTVEKERQLLEQGNRLVEQMVEAIRQELIQRAVTLQAEGLQRAENMERDTERMEAQEKLVQEMATQVAQMKEAQVTNHEPDTLSQPNHSDRRKPKLSWHLESRG